MAGRSGHFREEASALGSQRAAARLHLVIDADRYWLSASGDDLHEVSGFLKGHPGIVLTLVTQAPAWETCLALTQRPWVLPRHLIAEGGEEILHLTNGGEWNPDLEFKDWQRLLGNPQVDPAPGRLSHPAVALEYLECNCEAPRPLLVCLGSPEWKPVVGLADCAYLPASWAHMVNLPADTTFQTHPSLKGFLQILQPSTPFAPQTPGTEQPVLSL